VEVANAQIRNVMHLGNATGSEEEHGVREHYPGMFVHGSNGHLREIVQKAGELKKNSPDAMQTIARQRGHFGAHPPSEKRFEFVEDYKEQQMESVDRFGEQVTMMPVYGRGTLDQSKYAHLESATSDERDIVYGNPRTNRGSDRTSRFHSVGQAPTLRNGEIDYAKLYEEQNRRNGHISGSGRRNITGKVG
jgi:hypothetical protein